MAVDDVKLSMILPSYNGAETLARHVPVLQQYLRHLGITWEIVIADDGSDDAGATQQAAGRLGCVYVGNPVNQGKGAAVRRGMLAARGAFRIFTDCDVPYELTTIGR